ncbi:hypothetical protein B0T17DRAFT_510820 [Bombardia bombarda]|uniref:Uncharacterized protein n=1 Tax=Bombardia bombarda TaxID=252184 RepID=A0AA40BVB6_9PEZI|nr:hypothetical protein B0T17DRAFT_510820 [Bombardia bombarda]
MAAPVTRDGWSYAGDFYVEASVQNRHRRATISELKAKIDSSSEGAKESKDHPAHWYEAQLLHYGLPPSKTKGTAKMRLFEAVNKANLAVPSHTTKLETELKKEWTKKEREAKLALKKQAESMSTSSATKTTTKDGAKRKANDDQVQQAAPASDDDDEPLPPLGLLNGKYHIRWSGGGDGRLDDSNPLDSSIILTLDGSALWVAFEISPVSGILRLDHRPYQPSRSRCFDFDWRGEDTRGGGHDRTDDGSFLKFSGGGDISGELRFYDMVIEFDGYRLDG